VALTGWPTPMAGTPAQKGYNEAGNTDSSRKTVALLAGWPTPQRADDNMSRVENPQEYSRKRLQTRGAGQNLADTAQALVGPAISQLAGWPTPKSIDSTSNVERPEARFLREGRATPSNLSSAAEMVTGPARLTASGILQTGSTAETTNGGQLRPEFSRWLMGIPSEWDQCAPISVSKRKK